jgi:type I restriction enzyme R subunit
VSKTYDEKSFEEAIENSLPKEAPVESLYGQKAKQTAFVSGGFSSRRPDEYEKELCLIPSDLLQFIYATQPKKWVKYQKAAGNKAKDSLLQRVKKAVDDYGTLHVLRKGIKSLGSHFKLAFYKPVTGMNETLQELYRANIFSVVRQLNTAKKMKEKQSGMAVFLNGLPVFTAELKNHLTGQTVEDAMRQNRKDRDPIEPLFRLGRCLAHFAVDPELVYMTTELKKGATRFLPFNRGDGTGAGNPPSGYNKYATSYLWEEVWSRDGNTRPQYRTSFR